LALAAQSSIAEAWESLFNQSKFSAASPNGQFSVGVNKAKAKDAGVVAWIIKPHKDNVLLDGIRKVLKL
jgi:hypothetical protein